MKRKTVFRAIIIFLSLLAISGGLFIFHMRYGFWWDRPVLRSDIEKIVISEGGFIPPPPVGVEYTNSTITLTSESPEFQKIVKAIKSGWKYEQLALLKIPSYLVDIIYTDGSETNVDVYGNFLKIESQGVFRSLRNASEIIEEELKITE